MSSKVLENVNMGNTWTSFAGSVDGVLRAAGLWRDHLFKLMGMTGLAFHFIMHQSVCPSSLTVYDWLEEHVEMLTRIGIKSSAYQVWYGNNSQEFMDGQRQAIERIKASIGAGMAVIVWTPTPVLEFGIIYGYDDDDGVFIVKDCMNNESDPLLYTNLGRSSVPVLYYQLISESTVYDRRKTYRDSLNFAVREWNKQDHVDPAYASGRKAYDSLINALQKGDFDEFGLGYCLAVYADSKIQAARYLSFLSEDEDCLCTLKMASDHYYEVAGRYERMTALVPFSGCNGRGACVEREHLPELIRLLQECQALEAQGMEIIEQTVAELGQ